MARKSKRGKKRKKNKLRPDLQKSLTIIFLLVLSIMSFLSFLDLAGAVGNFINHYYSLLFGVAKYLVALLLLLWAIFIFKKNHKKKKYSRKKDLNFIHYLGAFLIVFNTAGLASFLVWLSMTNPEIPDLVLQIGEYKGGGYLGIISMALLAQTLGNILTAVILLALLVVGIIFTFQVSLNDIIHKTYIFEYLGKAIYLLFVGIINLFKGLGEAIIFLFSRKKEKPKIKSEEELFATLESVEEGKSEDIITDKVDLQVEDYDNDENEEDEDEDEVSDVPVYEAGDNYKNNDQSDLDIDIADGNALFPYQTEEVLNFDFNLSSELLDKKSSKPKSGDIKFKAQQIKKTLNNFGIQVEMKDVQVGPVVTQFSFKPAEGVKLSKITALHDDLSLALAAYPIRIEAPIPGKPYVGLEVPNDQSAIVRIRELIDSGKFKERKNNTQMVLGKDVSGGEWITDLTKMPHLLVAGQTGSGKSVCLNSIIVSLLYQNKPQDLRFIMVDPKRVELPLYNGIPHLLTPVITDLSKILNALKWLVAEMDKRYDILAKYSKRNIETYNKNAKEKMPYIVLLVDELADIMVQAGKEVESYIVRLTQMSRAVGIHLVIATQRPSVNVITGLIKANVPARIAFSVASQTDSRTIIDKAGAEKLIGKGDMLFLDPKSNKARRIQGVFVSDHEVKKIVNSLKLKLDTPVDYYEDVIDDSNEVPILGETMGNDKEEADPLFSQALDIVIKANKASASYLQRRLRIGFNRAARLIDQMEDRGIVGQARGSKPREVLIDNIPDDIIKTD